MILLGAGLDAFFDCDDLVQARHGGGIVANRPEKDKRYRATAFSTARSTSTSLMPSASAR
jgi:hypothetical protein